MNRNLTACGAAAAMLLAGVYSLAGEDDSRADGFRPLPAAGTPGTDRGNPSTEEWVTYGNGKTLTIFVPNLNGGSSMPSHNDEEGLLATRMRMTSDGTGHGVATLSVFDGSTKRVATLHLPQGSGTIELSFDPPIPITDGWSTTILTEDGGVLVEYTGSVLPVPKSAGDTMVVQ